MQDDFRKGRELWKRSARATGARTFLSALTAALMISTATDLVADDDFSLSNFVVAGAQTINGSTMYNYTPTVFELGGVQTLGSFKYNLILPNLLVNPLLAPAQFALLYTSTEGFAESPARLILTIADPVTLAPTAVTLDRSSLRFSRFGAATVRYNGGFAGSGGASAQISGEIRGATGFDTSTFSYRNQTLINSGKATSSILLSTGTSAVVLNTGSSLSILSAGVPTVFTLGVIKESFGVLQLGNGGTSGSIIATGINGGPGGGALVFNHNESQKTFSLPLTGTLSVGQTGSGNTILDGSLLYSGLTFVDAGTLTSTSSTAALTGGAETNEHRHRAKQCHGSGSSTALCLHATWRWRTGVHAGGTSLTTDAGSGKDR